MQVATGASGDFATATGIAREMVQTHGMSPLIGPMHVGKDASPEVRVQVSVLWSRRSALSPDLSCSAVPGCACTRLVPCLVHSSREGAEGCATGVQVDAEVSRLLTESYDRVLHLLVSRVASASNVLAAVALHILAAARYTTPEVALLQRRNMPKLVTISSSLLQHETLTHAQIQQLLSATEAASDLVSA